MKNFKCKENFHSIENEKIISENKFYCMKYCMSLSNENILPLNDDKFDRTSLISATIVY